MTNHRSWILAAAITLLFPAAAAAQACLGNAAGPGQGYLTAGASFTDGGWALGGTAGGNLDGPVSLEGGVSHTFLDNTAAAITGVGGTAAADLTTASPSVSVCPAASVSYQWLSNDAGTAVDLSGVVVGGGLAVGGDFEARSGLRFMPTATAALVHDRATASAGGVSSTDSETYGRFSGGLFLGGETVYAGPSASITTAEGSDPVFSVTLGFAF